jgi:hypothetical protein
LSHIMTKSYPAFFTFSERDIRRYKHQRRSREEKACCLNRQVENCKNVRAVFLKLEGNKKPAKPLTVRTDDAFFASSPETVIKIQTRSLSDSENAGRDESPQCRIF